jgi:hypothetical protein
MNRARTINRWTQTLRTTERRAASKWRGARTPSWWGARVGVSLSCFALPTSIGPPSAACRDSNGSAKHPPPPSSPCDELAAPGHISSAGSGRQFHQPSRASRLRIASARASTVLAVGHVASSKVVARIDLISRATRTHGSRYGSRFTDPPASAGNGGIVLYISVVDPQNEIDITGGIESRPCDEDTSTIDGNWGGAGLPAAHQGLRGRGQPGRCQPSAPQADRGEPHRGWRSHHRGWQADRCRRRLRRRRQSGWPGGPGRHRRIEVARSGRAGRDFRPVRPARRAGEAA